mgnify:CR=1 FL=1
MNVSSATPDFEDSFIAFFDSSCQSGGWFRGTYYWLWYWYCRLPCPVGTVKKWPPPNMINICRIPVEFRPGLYLYLPACEWARAGKLNEECQHRDMQCGDTPDDGVVGSVADDRFTQKCRPLRGDDADCGTRGACINLCGARSGSACLDVVGVCRNFHPQNVSMR